MSCTRELRECSACGKDTQTFEFKEFIGFKPCIIKEEYSIRESVEPIFDESKKLCYPCWKSEKNKYLRRQQ